MLHILDIAHRRLLRGIQSDNHRPKDARETAHLAHKTESLLQKDSRQDSGDDDRQRAQRSHQDRIDKGVSDEVANLADDHERHAQPPPEIFEIPVPLARFLVVFDVGLEQADFLDHE